MTRLSCVLCVALVLALASASAAQESSERSAGSVDAAAGYGTAPVAGVAQEAKGEGGDETPRGFQTGPAQSLLASAVYPGLGQLLNDTETKAAVVGGVEAFLIARLVLEDRWTRHSERLYNQTGKNVYFEEYSKHFDTRQTLLWWAVVAALYGIADAYVDAHLVGFDDLRPDLMDVWSDVPGSGDADALRVGFACRF